MGRCWSLESECCFGLLPVEALRKQGRVVRTLYPPSPKGMLATSPPLLHLDFLLPTMITHRILLSKVKPDLNFPNISSLWEEKP